MQEKIKIPVIINPKKFYVTWPTISYLVFTNDVIVIKTGRKEKTIRRKDIQEIKLEDEKAKIKLVNSEQIILWASSDVSAGGSDYDRTNLIVSLLKKFSEGKSINIDLLSKLNYIEKRGKRRIGIAIVFCILSGVVFAVTFDKFLQNPKYFLSFLFLTILFTLFLAKSKSLRHLERAVAALKVGNIDNALVYLEKAKGYIPYSPDLHFIFAVVYNLKGDITNEKKYLDKTLELKPNRSLTKIILIRIEEILKENNG